MNRRIKNQYYMNHGEMKRKRRIIFLDDSVLNKYVDTNNVGVDEFKVIKLKLLSLITKAEFVLISDDRYEIMKTFKSYIPYNNFKPENNRLIYLLKKYNIDIVGVTPNSVHKRKCDEILSWLAVNERGTLTYAILSNKKLEFDVLNDKLILCRTGLRLRHIKKAYRKLNYTF